MIDTPRVFTTGNMVILPKEGQNCWPGLENGRSLSFFSISGNPASSYVGYSLAYMELVMAMVWCTFTVMNQSSIRACLTCCLHTFLSPQHIKQPLHLLCCKGAAWYTKTSPLVFFQLVNPYPLLPRNHLIIPWASCLTQAQLLRDHCFLLCIQN